MHELYTFNVIKVSGKRINDRFSFSNDPFRTLISACITYNTYNTHTLYSQHILTEGEDNRTGPALRLCLQHNAPSIWRLQLVVHHDETNCMWSTGNFIKADFPAALVISVY